MKVANEQKVVYWKNLIHDLTNLIQDNYNGKSIKVYLEDWKRKIKLAAKSMGYKLDRFDKDIFASLDITTKNAESLNIKSTSSNYKLTISEHKRVIDLFNSIPTTAKWVLSTSKIVDDEMKALAEKSCYEHPVHSMIIEVDDPIWKKHFTTTEINEIKSFRLKGLPNIPEEVEEYLNKYNKDWKSGKELYEYADDQKHDPITQFNFKWIRESIMRASELFFYEDTLNLNDLSESDLLHELWPFVYRVFRDREIKAHLGERSSVAVALGRNENRCLEAEERRPRKAIGGKVDILFKTCKKELGSCEVGKDSVVIIDSKYFDDGLIKLPKTLRDMLSVLAKENPAQVNNLSTVGFLLMGLTMELVIMDCPVGHHITRVSRTPKLEFPSTLKTFAIDFLPLLEAAWKGKEAMKNTVETLNNRKRKIAELNAITKDNSVSFPYSFVRSSRN
ncbi:hypothetical protein G6F43_011378 [Rhizopus delemar]|nr:hypothetical protein G6F43_011378 [Rhizopus delemar]